MIGRKLLRFSPIVLVLVVAACGGGGGTKTVTVTETVTRTVVAPHLVKGRVYFLRDGKVAPVARDLSGTSERELLQALAAGPTPQDTRSGLTSNAGNTANSPGDRGWLAQVVYTLSQFDPAGRVTYENKSYTRADFEDETPIILVESPLPFQTVHSPLRATGTSNTFEATFQYELVGPGGTVIAKHFVTATSGTGTRGTFDFTVPFTISQSGQGKLVVFELSAKDGSRIHQSEIPLTLEP
jgi:germination protein M